MEAQARDLFTPATGAPAVVGRATASADVDGATRELRTFRTEPEVPALQSLLGAVVGPGFRARVDEVVPDQREEHSLLYLLFDDLPGAGLVSGYALLQTDVVPRARPDEYLSARGDLCAGWANDGSMMTMIREHGQNPTPLGPPAPSLDRTGDPIAWHTFEPLPPIGMRRVRRIDVIPQAGPRDPYDVDVFFRDSSFGLDATETVVHEYSVRAVVDAASCTVVSISATPNVLPWQECPQAIDSASRLIGRSLADLRPWVRATFVGTTTCTHLNDVLRGLTDVSSMIDQLVALPADAA